MLNFGSLESAVLECLWRRREPCTVRDVAQELNVTRPLAYTTVMTVMDRLQQKGVLRREKAGHIWRYSTVHTSHEHAAAVMREVLDGTQDRRAALTSFAAGLDDEARLQLGEALLKLGQCSTTTKREGEPAAWTSTDPPRPATSPNRTWM